jgi:hypothetical protein
MVIPSGTAPVPALASVIVLTIQDFTRSPVPEQIRLKAQLEALLTLAIQPLAADDRIVLEAPAGAALVILAAPRVALEVVERCQAAAAHLPLRIGLNYGPVVPASDALGASGLVGDGLAAATALANAAAPGRFLVSRSFHDALEGDAPGRAADLSSAGVFTDPKVRAHELYTLDQRAAPARRRRLLIYGTVSVVAILASGIASRLFLHTAAPPKPATVEFIITPRGEIFVDGVHRGRSPPLTRLELDPGPHTIEVRNSPHPPLRLNVALASAEDMTINHTFGGPKMPAKASAKSASKTKDGGDPLRDLRRLLGF